MLTVCSSPRALLVCFAFLIAIRSSAQKVSVGTAVENAAEQLGWSCSLVMFFPIQMLAKVDAKPAIERS